MLSIVPDPKRIKVTTPANPVTVRWYRVRTFCGRRTGSAAVAKCCNTAYAVRRFPNIAIRRDDAMDEVADVAGIGSVAGLDLHLDRVGGRVRDGVMDAIRNAIRSGRLVPGTRLPSSRALAADLGVARNTVARAYAELIAEGWLTAQHGSATLVSQRAGEVVRSAAAPP